MKRLPSILYFVFGTCMATFARDFSNSLSMACCLLRCKSSIFVGCNQQILESFVGWPSKYMQFELKGTQRHRDFLFLEDVSKNKFRHGLHGLTRIYISFYTRTVIIYPCNPRNPCLKNKWLHFDFTLQKGRTAPQNTEISLWCLTKFSTSACISNFLSNFAFVL